MARPKRRQWRNKTATTNPPVDAAAQPIYGNYVTSRPCRCGKNGYTAKAYARTVQREMRRRGDPEGDILDVYRCHEDDTHWHVGHDRGGVLRPDLNDPSTWTEDDFSVEAEM